MLGRIFWLLILFSLTGCKTGDFRLGSGDGGEDATTGCGVGQRRCSGDSTQVCKDGVWTNETTCVSPQICSASLARCTDCNPGISFCKGDDLYSCNSDGTLGAKKQTCAKAWCNGGQCIDPCVQAKAEKSYIGCTYYPTVTSNAGLAQDFQFAVAVANTFNYQAKVTVYTGSGSVAHSTTVAANSVATIKLPWVLGLKNAIIGSTKVAGGTYMLTSTLPVTVYQFNPLNYELPYDCIKTKETQYPTNDNKCNSFSNDASLLLPEHALGTEYMVVTRPAMMNVYTSGISFSPGFFSVVATAKGATSVKIKFSADAEPPSGSPTTFKKGQTTTITLNQHDVLQMVSLRPKTCTPTTSDSNGSYCDLKAAADFTGTFISSDKKVAVFAGHNCTFVPYNKWACDHLEEQLFPTVTLGVNYIGSHTASSDDPNMYKVVSVNDENIISFDPPVVPTRKLGQGQYIEFLSKSDFEVKGTGRFVLAKFMVGQSYSKSASNPGAPGDPAMALAVPVGQYRYTYRFLAPASYQKNYVNIHAPKGATVRLDGKLVKDSEFKLVNNSSGYRVARVQLKGGAHTIKASSQVGITVYGVGSYTSYMYPGGLDLKILK